MSSLTSGDKAKKETDKHPGSLTEREFEQKEDGNIYCRNCERKVGMLPGVPRKPFKIFYMDGTDRSSADLSSFYVYCENCDGRPDVGDISLNI